MEARRLILLDRSRRSDCDRATLGERWSLGTVFEAVLILESLREGDFGEEVSRSVGEPASGKWSTGTLVYGGRGRGNLRQPIEKEKLLGNESCRRG